MNTRCLVLMILYAVLCNVSASLELLVIHKEKFEDSKAISVDEFDLDGFTSSKPDLEIKKLKNASMRLDKQKWTRMNRDGTNKVEGVDEVFLIQIEFDKEAQKKFKALTKQAIGKRILIRIGGQPLLAPRVNAEIDTPSLEISVMDEAKAKRLLKALRELTDPNNTEQSGAD